MLFRTIFATELICLVVIIFTNPVFSSSSAEITVAFSKRDPFVVRNQYGELGGLDILIINNFARKVHLNVKYMEQNSSLNEILENQEFSEKCLARVNSQKIDILIGALDDHLLMNEHFIASRAYYYDALTWCVQTKNQIPNWKNILYLCNDPLVYFIYTLMCVSVVFTGYFMQQYEDFQPKWDWFRLSFAGISPCLGLPSEYSANIIPNRIFFVFALLGATLSYIVTNSILLLFVQNPLYEKQIEMREEIIHKQFELVGDGFALQHLKAQSQIYPSKILENYETCNDLNICLRQLLTNSKLAVAISREHAQSSRLVPQPFCFDKSEIIHEYALKFLVRRDFPHLKEMNRFIATASASGLIQKWHSKNQLRQRIKKADRTIFENYKHSNYKTLYFIWFSIIGFLFLIFHFERVIHRRLKSRNHSRFWSIAEMIIDPNRHFWLETKYLNGHPAF